MPLQMKTGARLDVIGNNVQVTPALKEAAEAKLAKPLDRYEAMLMSTTLHMKVENRGGGVHDEQHKGLEAHVVELTAHCRDKQVIHLSSESPDMYASLDKMSELFGRQLRKTKEKFEERKDGKHRTDGKLEEDEDEEEVAVPPAM